MAAPPPRPGGPPDAPARPQGGIARLRSELEEDIGRIEGEIGEIDMLMEQVLVEIERHEARRTKLATHLESLEQLAAPDRDALGEARADLMMITRRELLFDAQRQVLEGKQRILARFLQRLVEIDNSLAAMGGTGPERPAPPPTAELPAPADTSATSGAPGSNQPALQLRSQEDLRRDIVRQLHDGPAQSLANIGLQAEIVERLVKRRDDRAAAEIEALHTLVQQALDTTKEFIFEVRPMVLDDLGLGPTVRRACTDRSRRADIPVDFDSQGIEQRLESDLESAVFRTIDEAIAGYLLLRPPSVLVRLDWTGRDLLATVEGTWPRASGTGDRPGPTGPAGRAGETPAFLLAMMEEKRSAERDALTASRALSPDRVVEMQKRARAVGMSLTMRDDGQVIEISAPMGR